MMSLCLIFLIENIRIYERIDNHWSGRNGAYDFRYGKGVYGVWREIRY